LAGSRTVTSEQADSSACRGPPSDWQRKRAGRRRTPRRRTVHDPPPAAPTHSRRDRSTEMSSLQELGTINRSPEESDNTRRRSTNAHLVLACSLRSAYRALRPVLMRTCDNNAGPTHPTPTERTARDLHPAGHGERSHIGLGDLVHIIQAMNNVFRPVTPRSHRGVMVRTGLGPGSVARLL